MSQDTLSEIKQYGDLAAEMSEEAPEKARRVRSEPPEGDAQEEEVEMIFGVESRAAAAGEDGEVPASDGEEPSRHGGGYIMWPEDSEDEGFDDIEAVFRKAAGNAGAGVGIWAADHHFRHGQEEGQVEGSDGGEAGPMRKIKRFWRRRGHGRRRGKGHNRELDRMEDSGEEEEDSSEDLEGAEEEASARRQRKRFWRRRGRCRCRCRGKGRNRDKDSPEEVEDPSEDVEGAEEEASLRPQMKRFWRWRGPGRRRGKGGNRDLDSPEETEEEEDEEVEDLSEDEEDTEEEEATPRLQRKRFWRRRGRCRCRCRGKGGDHNADSSEEVEEEEDEEVEGSGEEEGEEATPYFSLFRWKAPGRRRHGAKHTKRHADHGCKRGSVRDTHHTKRHQEHKKNTDHHDGGTEHAEHGIDLGDAESADVVTQSPPVPLMDDEGELVNFETD